MLAWADKRKTIADQNVLHMHFRSQYTGIGMRRLSQVPTEILDDINDRFDLSYIPSLVQELDEFSTDPDYDASRCLDLLKDIFSHLTNFEARRANQAEQDEEHNKFAKCFMHMGGVDVLLRLLMYDSLLPEEVFRKRETEVHLRIKSVILEVLCKIIATKCGEELGVGLAVHPETMNYLFTLLVHDKTCMTACQFLEDLLQARKDVLNLTTIANLKSLVTHMDDRQLANFSRVLAVTISDLDIYENKSSLFAQNKQKRTKGFINARDVNQELLLSIPDLIPRLISLATAKSTLNSDYPRFHGMVSELDNWMEWIDNSISDHVADSPTTDDFEGFIGGISEPSAPNGIMVQQPGLKISMDLIMKVQVIYVLGLFLIGKHRKKVQKKLAELHLVPGLSDLFDQFIWKCQAHRNNSRHRLRGHNASCECSPEVALKIQFLRLIHSFCDHSEYKHLLLSRGELNELKRINTKAGPLKLENLDHINKGLMCRGSRGLLTKIVDVMKKEPTASTFRFWLARAVESYLRGSTSYCDQIFLLRKGLVEHIAQNIVEHDIRPKEILQSSFDLLGELIKFNGEVFRSFDRILGSKQKLEKFLKVIKRNLVDSNMFIRALILSLEHFYDVQNEHREFARAECGLLQHVGDFEQQLDYLRRLINLINVRNLTQENVSCLNTVLVFLMFGNRKAVLPRYVRGLMVEPVPSGQCTNNQTILKNFRELLLFWQDHYLHKDKDCSALEKSSRISFDFWKETVKTLVSEDRNLETSILHYVDADYQRDS